MKKIDFRILLEKTGKWYKAGYRVDHKKFMKLAKQGGWSKKEILFDLQHYHDVSDRKTHLTSDPVSLRLV